MINYNEEESVTILAPAYNEEKNITLLLNELKENIPIHWKVLIVNDGSKDSTEYELLKLKERYKNFAFISHKRNLGIGKAFETGFNNIHTEYVITIDADMSHGIEMINILYLNRNKSDVVLASIFDKSSNVEKASKIRLFISKIGNIFLSLIFGFEIKEIAGGPRIYKSKYLKNIKIYNTGFESQIEILLYAKKMGAKFSEVPIVLTKRAYGKSKMNYQKMLIGILRVYFKYLRNR